MLQFDVVIVGAGPSGSALGYLLQTQWISCCVVDRARFPREKLCGGLLSEKTVAALRRIYGDTDFPRERESSSVSLFYGEQKLCGATVGAGFWLVERKRFDAALLDRYRQRGGRLIEADAVRGVSRTARTVELQSGQTLRYSILVGADGANSTVRKLLAPDYRPNAICVEAAVAAETVSDEVCVYFTDNRSGYAWCFPKRGHYTVGMGGDIRWNRQIREDFQRFARQIGKPAAPQAIRGAMVPFGKYVKRPCADDVLLVGDAAGLADPVTGEGLYFALRSAELAAAAIVRRLRTGEALAPAYGKALREIHRRIDDARRFQRIFLSPPVKKRLLPRLSGREGLLRFYCDNLLAQDSGSYLSFPIRYLARRRKRSHGHGI